MISKVKEKELHCPVSWLHDVYRNKIIEKCSLCSLLRFLRFFKGVLISGWLGFFKKKRVIKSDCWQVKSIEGERKRPKNFLKVG